MSGRDPHEAHRVATPLELLFDLTFVISFGFAASQLAHALAEGHFLGDCLFAELLSDIELRSLSYLVTVNNGSRFLRSTARCHNGCEHRKLPALANSGADSDRDWL